MSKEQSEKCECYNNSLASYDVNSKMILHFLVFLAGNFNVLMEIAVAPEVQDPLLGTCFHHRKISIESKTKTEHSKFVG